MSKKGYDRVPWLVGLLSMPQRFVCFFVLVQVEGEVFRA